MKLAHVVGHNAQSQGAVRKDTGVTEYIWNLGLSRLMEQEARHFPEIELKTFLRHPAPSYSHEIKRVYREVDAWGADASIESHFNSHMNPKATGTEVLSSGTAASLRFANAMQQEFLDLMGLKDRGVKVRRDGRGSFSLIFGAAPAILIEPFFGSSPHGLQATDEPHEKRELARAILRAAETAFC